MFFAIVAAAATAIAGKVEIRVEPKQKAEPLFFDVKPGAIYHLSFRARIDGVHTVERNRQLAEAFYDVLRESRGLRWPRWNVDFIMADGKTQRNGFVWQYWNTVFTGKERTYDDLFQVPYGCEKVKVSFRNPSLTDTLVFAPPTLEKVKTPYLNPNPDFAYRVNCHAGYSAGQVRMKRTADGTRYMHVPSHVGMDALSVKPNHRYQIDIALMPGVEKGSGNGVTFIDAQGKSIPRSGGTLIAKKKDLGVKEVFISPTNAVTMSILLRGTDYRHVRITDLGEATK